MREDSRPWIVRRLTPRATRAAIALVLMLVIMALVIGPQLVLRRDRVEQILSDYFGGEVGLSSFDALLFPWPRAEGTGLTVRLKGRTDVPPLIAAERVVLRTSLLGALFRSKRVGLIRFEALQITVPPDPAVGFDLHELLGEETVIERIEVENSRLIILRDNADDDPVTFELYNLTLENLALDRPFTFTVTMTNPEPVGLIEATGEIGPWHIDHPRRTPVSGEYSFTGVDLSTLRGIGGTLSSEGHFEGRVERIEVSGHTRTPDFYLSTARRRLPLTTKFQAIVNGTNGETYLRPVRATLARSHVVARGGVTKTRGRSGRTVALDVTVERGRIEDFLRLGFKQEPPPLTGGLRLTAAFVLPPGKHDWIKRLRLKKAELVIDHGHFPGEMQDKVDELSRRAQGRSEDEPVQDAAWDLRGILALEDGVAQLSKLTFRTHGATLDVNGTYAVEQDRFDLQGTARLQEEISDMADGIKSLLLKLLDPLFRDEGAGAVIPIRITGSRRAPSVSIDKKKVLTGSR